MPSASASTATLARQDASLLCITTAAHDLAFARWRASHGSMRTRSCILTVAEHAVDAQLMRLQDLIVERLRHAMGWCRTSSPKRSCTRPTRLTPRASKSALCFHTFCASSRHRTAELPCQKRRTAQLLDRTTTPALARTRYNVTALQHVYHACAVDDRNALHPGRRKTMTTQACCLHKSCPTICDPSDTCFSTASLRDLAILRAMWSRVRTLVIQSVVRLDWDARRPAKLSAE